jgi:excisionase family DNA binding protein
MKRIRRTEVTVEMDEIILITGSQATCLPQCPHCGDDVAMITPEQAAEIVGANTRAIYRWIEEGRIHSAESAKGRLLICPRSLCKAIGPR